MAAIRCTPWQGLEEHGCGWWVDPTVDGLVEALRDAMAKEPAQMREMGMRGQVYAREFDWGNIARQTVVFLPVDSWAGGSSGLCAVGLTMHDLTD